MNSMKVQPQKDEDEEAACMFAMKLATASVLPMILKSAIELDLLQSIAKAGPGASVSPSELAAQLPSTQPGTAVMLDRILRLLATYSELHCKFHDGQRLYALAPVCKFLTKNSDDVSIAPLLLTVQDKISMECWYHLKDVVLDGGIPFNKAHGMTSFEYYGKDPRYNKLFNCGMSSHSTIIMKNILRTYNGFDGLKTLVDVGGGTGATLSMIISNYPQIKGINFDLPQVIQNSTSYPGVEHVGGDMFVRVPKGDVKD